MNSKSRIPASVEHMEIDNIGEIECDPYLQDDASEEETSTTFSEEDSMPVHVTIQSSITPELLFVGAEECSGAYHWRQWYILHEKICSHCQIDLNQIFSLILSQLSLVSQSQDKRDAMKRQRISTSQRKYINQIDAAHILVDSFVRPYLNSTHPGVWSSDTLPPGYIDASRAVAYCDDHDCASLGDDGVQIRDFPMGVGAESNIGVLNADYIRDYDRRGVRVRSPAVSEKEMVLLEHLRELSNISVKAYQTFIGVGDNSRPSKKDSSHSSNDEEEEGD